jgi:hypothetical protein
MGRSDQGLLPFEFAPLEEPTVTSWSGLTLLVDMMRSLGLEEQAKRIELRERAAGSLRIPMADGIRAALRSGRRLHG